MILKLMPCRESIVYATLEAWSKTGISFLAAIDNSILPIENCIGDDLGLYYCVPFLARTFSLSLVDALWWFDFGMVSIGALVVIIGFFYLTKTTIEKLAVVGAVLGMSTVAWLIGNLYMVPFFAFCFFPWVFVFLREKMHKSLLCYWLLIGVVIAFVGSIRMYSGFALAIAGLLAVFLYSKKIRLTLLCTLLMFCGVGGYSYWFSSVLFERNAYLDSHEVAYGNYRQSHPFWHSIYIGLGFITNDLELCYSDSCSESKARETNPKVLTYSGEYEQILKNETINICRHHPQFVIRMFFAKCGVLFYYLLMFGNVGLLCAWFYRKPWFIELPYFFALCFSALPGLLTVPVAEYLVGFFTVATFYGIHSIIWALQHGLQKRIKVFLSYFFKIAA